MYYRPSLYNNSLATNIQKLCSYFSVRKQLGKCFGGLTVWKYSPLRYRCHKRGNNFLLVTTVWCLCSDPSEPGSKERRSTLRSVSLIPTFCSILNSDHDIVHPAFQSIFLPQIIYCPMALTDTSRNGSPGWFYFQLSCNWKEIITDFHSMAQSFFTRRKGYSVDK